MHTCRFRLEDGRDATVPPDTPGRITGAWLVRTIAQERYPEPFTSKDVIEYARAKGWLKDGSCSSGKGFITPNAVYVAIYKLRRRGLLKRITLKGRRAYVWSGPTPGDGRTAGGGVGASQGVGCGGAGAPREPGAGGSGSGSKGGSEPKLGYGEAIRRVWDWCLRNGLDGRLLMPSEAIKDLGINKSSVWNAFWELAKRGALVRVSRGLYRVNPDYVGRPVVRGRGRGRIVSSGLKLHGTTVRVRKEHLSSRGAGAPSVLRPGEDCNTRGAGAPRDGHGGILPWILKGLPGAYALMGTRNGGLDGWILDDGPFRFEEHRDALIVKWRGSPVPVYPMFRGFMREVYGLLDRVGLLPPAGLKGHLPLPPLELVYTELTKDIRAVVPKFIRRLVAYVKVYFLDDPLFDVRVEVALKGLNMTIPINVAVLEGFWRKAVAWTSRLLAKLA